METEAPPRRHPLAECEKCSLNVRSAAFVPSQQAPSGETKLVVVGEAPGYKEGRTGIPFTGPSGKLLDAVLRGHGLRREDTFITNTCLCRPRDNATPSARDVAACSGRLRSELNDATGGGAPIVTLGVVAASAVFGTKVAITSFRTGPAKASPLYPGVRIIPTVHPAYVLRTSDAFPLFNTDIGKVNAHATIRWEAPKFAVFDEEHDARRALQELCERPGDLVLDIEAGKDKDSQFIHPDQYQLLCVGLCYAPGLAIVIGETALRSGRRDGKSPVRDMLARLLNDRYPSGPGRGRNIAHNGKFDLAGLKHIADRAPLGFDTMLASYAVDERPGTHGLKYLTAEHLGAPAYDLEIHKYLGKDKNYADIPRDILYKYNAFDVVGTWGLKDMYDASMTDDERGVHDMLCRWTPMMMQAEMRGLTVDREYLDKIDEEQQEEMFGRELGLAQWVKNPRSPMQIKQAFMDMGVRLPNSRKETLEIALRTLRGEPEDFIRQLLAYRHVQKQNSTYVRGILRRMYKGRVHPTFLMHGTVTGRFSCRNPNLFNIPRASSMRRMFIPAPGRVFVQGDYKMAELRVMACEARDEYLRQLFADGRDIHNEIAERFFGPGFTKDQRVRAKAVVFGLNYGREAYSLAQEMDITEQEAQAYVDGFFSVVPQIVKWRQGIEDQLLHGEDDLRTHFGRHRRVWLVTDDNRRDIVKEGLAFIPQATVSDITLSAGLELTEKYGLDFRLYVYDSLLVECDPGEVDDVSAIMREVMPRVAKEVYSDYLPFDVDISSGNSWGEL